MGRKLKKIWTKVIKILAIALILGSVSCAKEEDKKEETIKIGFIVSLTGDFASFGETMVNAARLAESEINEGGGVLGKKIELKICDDGTTPDGAKSCFDKLTSEGIKLIIGPTTSLATIKGICGGNIQSCDPVKQKRVLIISPSATSPLITKIDDDGLIWRNAPSDDLQGGVLAELARGKIEGLETMKVDKVSVIYRDDPYGAKLAEKFKDEFEKLGGTVLKFVKYAEDKETGFSSEIQEAYGSGNPDALVLITFTKDGVNLLKDLKSYIEQNNKPKPKLFGCDGNMSTSISGEKTITDLIKDNFVGTAPSAPVGSEIYKAFSQKYNQKYGKPPEVFNDNVYDLVYILAMGIQAAGEPDADKVKEKLPQLTAGGEKVKPVSAGGNWKDIITKISQGVDIDYDGASGSNEFDGNGDIKSGVYNIWKVINNNGNANDFQSLIK
ncbi:MAG: ABC transporter substrate-binding protein [Candidatus Calescibacterium sp.]